MDQPKQEEFIASDSCKVSLRRDRSYVSMITNDSYLPGIQLLAMSLKDTSPKYPLTVLVTPETISAGTKKKLVEISDNVVEVNSIARDVTSSSSVRIAHWSSSEYTKINIWKLTDYEKVVYIDADCMVLENVDDVRPM